MDRRHGQCELLYNAVSAVLVRAALAQAEHRKAFPLTVS